MKPPPHPQVPALVSDWVEEVCATGADDEPIAQAIARQHAAFERIHPFSGWQCPGRPAADEPGPGPARISTGLDRQAAAYPLPRCAGECRSRRSRDPR
ncbi:MAG TPA: Fic family protein [Candidatus Dormibacteraeota bacterium]|nr:Fic family protein [Candidatus Dormibacteraeota bacterium]